MLRDFGVGKLKFRLHLTKFQVQRFFGFLELRFELVLRRLALRSVLLELLLSILKNTRQLRGLFLTRLQLCLQVLDLRRAGLLHLLVPKLQLLPVEINFLKLIFLTIHLHLKLFLLSQEFVHLLLILVIQLRLLLSKG